MEDEKFHNLLSVSWKRRKAGGVTQFESKGLGTREVNPIVRAEDGMRYPSSLVREEKKEQIPPSSTFSSIQVLNGLYDAHLHWGGQTTKSTYSNVISSGNTFTDTLRHKV